MGEKNPERENSVPVSFKDKVEFLLVKAKQLELSNYGESRIILEGILEVDCMVIGVMATTSLLEEKDIIVRSFEAEEILDSLYNFYILNPDLSSKQC